MSKVWRIRKATVVEIYHLDREYSYNLVYSERGKRTRLWAQLFFPPLFPSSVVEVGIMTQEKNCIGIAFGNKTKEGSDFYLRSWKEERKGAKEEENIEQKGPWTFVVGSRSRVEIKTCKENISWPWPEFLFLFLSIPLSLSLDLSLFSISPPVPWELTGLER